MIKKLKWKFVLIIMLVALLLLSAMFCTVYAVTDATIGVAIDVELKQVLFNRQLSLFGAGEELSSRLPVFAVRIDAFGNARVLASSFYQIDEQTAIDICNECLERSESQGYLSGRTLRYMRLNDANGVRIAFADVSAQRAVLGSLVRVLTGIGLVCMAIIFGLSLLLSNIAVRPTALAWEKQKAFVADASHELNTPLTVIISNMELLEENSSLDEESKTRLERVRYEADRMKHLTGELLNLARTESGASGVLMTDVDLSSAVYSQSLLYEPLFFENGCALEYDVAPGVVVRGNEEQLKQLVGILLDNARKYSASNLPARLSLEVNTKKRAVLAVRSFGSVIPPEKLINIFERFYRTDAARTENGGYGLGLAIASNIVATHKGTITAQSDEANGTVFTVTLPTNAPKYR